MYIPLLYTFGSTIFLASSVLFHPQFTADPSVYLAAVCGFVLGSMVFAMAGGMGVWAVMRSQVSDMGAWGAAILSLIGALLLLAGSLAFWPGLGTAGPTIGAYTFRAGSFAYIFSSGWSLRAVWVATPTPRRLCAATRWQLGTLLSYSAGAVAFIGGGMGFLRDEATLGSALWAFGSLMFLIGSAITLSQSRDPKVPRLYSA